MTRSSTSVSKAILELLGARIDLEKALRIERDPVLSKLQAELLVSIEFNLAELFGKGEPVRVDTGSCRLCACSPRLPCGPGCYLIQMDLCAECERMMRGGLMVDRWRSA